MGETNNETKEEIKGDLDLLHLGIGAAELFHIGGKWVPLVGSAIGAAKLAMSDSPDEAMCSGMEMIPLLGILPTISGCGMQPIVGDTGKTQYELDAEYNQGAQSIDPNAAAAAHAAKEAELQQSDPYALLR